LPRSRLGRPLAGLHRASRRGPQRGARRGPRQHPLVSADRRPIIILGFIGCLLSPVPHEPRSPEVRSVLVCPRTWEGDSRYPVASAKLPRSGPGAGVHVEHPAAERHGPLPLVCYAAGADVAGYLRQLTTHHLWSQHLAIPEWRPAGGTCALV
jgi:hypothetical protein